MTTPAGAPAVTRGSRTFRLGLLGAGISGSLTPALQEQEGREHGLDLRYVRLDSDQRGFGVEELPDVLAWAEEEGYDGLNVTHPFKQAVVPLLDDLSVHARDLGAVNTVVLRDGRRVGHNTDVTGFARAFRQALPEAVHDRVAMVGAGGAGVAVGYGLLDLGVAHLAVHDVDPDRAEQCVARLARTHGAARVEVASDVEAAVGHADGLVNATPLGMSAHPGLSVPESLVRPGIWVADVVYFPLETELVALARSRGCRVLPGGGMAVQQAVDAFGHFTGLVADEARMQRHFEELTA